LIEDNVAVPARLVSEGTLRLLGLLAVTSSTEPSTLIAFEEPENGVHPRRIGLIADFLKSQSSSGGRQFIVTTHSPILPDLLPDEALFVARRSGACTTITAFRDAGALFRKNEIDEALEDSEEVTTTVSERILRGDFDE
jgi:predicted ATPase